MVANFSPEYLNLRRQSAPTFDPNLSPGLSNGRLARYGIQVRHSVETPPGAIMQTNQVNSLQPHGVIINNLPLNHGMITNVIPQPNGMLFVQNNAPSSMHRNPFNEGAYVERRGSSSLQGIPNSNQGNGLVGVVTSTVVLYGSRALQGYYMVDFLELGVDPIPVHESELIPRNNPFRS